MARVGGGDLRSLLIVLTMGISAYLTLDGPFSGVRIWAFGSSETASATQSFAHAASQLFGIQIEIAGMMIAAAILVVTFLSRSMRRSPSFIFWGTVAGLAIVSGWAGTQWVASNGFDATPVISHTFSAAIGESNLYAMTSSGNSISFGTGSIVGVLLGSFLGSLYKGHFRWEACEDPVSYAAKFQEPF